MGKAKRFFDRQSQSGSLPGALRTTHLPNTSDNIPLSSLKNKGGAYSFLSTLGGNMINNMSFRRSTIAISSGVVDLALVDTGKGFITVQAESGTTDTITDINNPSFENPILLIQADSGDTITLTNSGNINTGTYDYILESLEIIMLIYNRDNTSWEILNNSLGDHRATQDLDLGSNDIIIGAGGSGNNTFSAVGAQVLFGSDGSEVFRINGTSSLIQIADGINLKFNTSTGSQIGTSGSQKIGFFGVTPVVQRSAYTVTNHITDRSYDANSTTVAELADVLGTLIVDLRSLGLIAT